MMTMRFRPKLGSERDIQWRCFFCLHVRTGTILLGSWHLILHLSTLAILTTMARDSHMIRELEKPHWGESDEADIPLPTPLSNVETSGNARITPSFNEQNLMYLCTVGITMLLIHGASRGRPAHLLPFFCLQLFDFAITVLTVMGYLCYLRTVHQMVADAAPVPWSDELQSLPAPALAFIVLAIFALAVFLKGYCIGVVWRCYKYLTMRQHALASLTPFVISREVPVPPPHPAPPAPLPDYSSLLPAYEEAVKQTPPPSYRAAALMAAADPTLTDVDANAVPAPPPPAAVVVMISQPRGDQDRV